MNKAQEAIYKNYLDLAAEAIAARAAGKKASKSNANVMMQLRQAAIHPLLFRKHYTDAKILQMSHGILGEDIYSDCNQQLVLEDMEVMNDLELNKLCVNNPKTMGKYTLKRKEWMASGKVEALTKLLMEMREKGDRVLIFSQFTQVLDLLELVMTTLGVGFLRIDGSTPVDMRQDMIDQYHEEEDIMTFLLSTKAGGFGINLACANKVVIFDSSFNPHDDAQASDRAHRVGQTREVESIRHSPPPPPPLTTQSLTMYIDWSPKVPSKSKFLRWRIPSSPSTSPYPRMTMRLKERLRRLLP